VLRNDFFTPHNNLFLGSWYENVLRNIFCTS